MKSQKQIEERITRLTEHAEFFKNEALLDSGKPAVVMAMTAKIVKDRATTIELMKIEERGFRAQVYALQWVLGGGPAIIDQEGEL